MIIVMLKIVKLSNYFFRVAFFGNYNFKMVDFFGNLVSVLDPDDFYLCDLLRVWSSGFKNLDLLVNVG